MTLKLVLILAIISFQCLIHPNFVSTSKSPASPPTIEEDSKTVFEPISQSVASSPRFISPLSTADFMSNSPIFNQNFKLSLVKNKNSSSDKNQSSSSSSSTKSDTVMKSSPEFANLSDDLILMIADYLDSPFQHLPFINSHFLRLFLAQKPAEFIFRRFGGSSQSFLQLPFSRNFAYLSSMPKSYLEDDRILSVIYDVSLVKMIPEISNPILRFLWSKIIQSYQNRLKLIQNQPPYRQTLSPIAALIKAFLRIKDYEMVYQVLDEFPVLHLNTHVFLDENFIEFSFKNRRTDSYLRNLFRNRDLDLQVIYDIACKYFAISFDLQILNTFLQNLFRQNEYNSPNYVKTELNAIILALTYPEVFSEEQTDSLTEFESHLENMHTFNDPSVIFKKSLALIMTYVRLGNVERTRRLLDSLQILHFRKSAYECILWTMVSVEKFDLFFEFLDRLILEDSRFEAFDMTSLKVAIAKSRSEPFIEELMRRYDVSKMFSGNLGGEAVYSKRLHLRLLRFADETALFSHSILNENLFLYAVHHFKDNIEDWERFFELNQVMSYSSFASLIAYLLVNHRSLPVFELILRLFIDNRIRFATWGRPDIVFNLDAAKFIFENPTLHELIGFLRERFRLCCESDVMSYLIIFHGDANKALLFKAFKFEMKDFLIQLNTWRQLKLAQKIFNWTDGYLITELRRNIQELSLLNQSDALGRLEFEKSIMIIFGHIFRGLYEHNPLGYLALIPYNYLRHVLANNPEFVTRAVLSASSNGRNLAGFLNRVQGCTITVTEPIPDNVCFENRHVRFVIKPASKIQNNNSSSNDIS